MKHKEAISLLNEIKAKIHSLEEMQALYYKKCLLELQYQTNSEPEATVIFDFLYNNYGTAVSTLKRLKEYRKTRGVPKVQ